MRELRPAPQRQRAGQRIVTALLANSLVLYIAAAAAHRSWALLNSDVMQLFRRVH